MKGCAFLMLQQDDGRTEWLRRELAINLDEPISDALLGQPLRWTVSRQKRMRHFKDITR
jgi:hypothetical protein